MTSGEPNNDPRDVPATEKLEQIREFESDTYHLPKLRRTLSEPIRWLPDKSQNQHGQDGKVLCAPYF